MDTIAQVALMSKANQVFSSPGNFLSFPILTPFAWKPDDLNFANAFADPEVFRTLLDLSLIVNSLPTGTLFQGGADNYLWQGYDQWLKDMVLAKDQMTADERAQYDQAKALLTVKDANGFSVDSPIVVAYKQYRDAWFSAAQNYKNEQMTAISSSDPAVQTQWKDVDEPRLRALVEQANSDWENKGNKAGVENAQTMKAQLDARSPSNAWNEWRSAFDPILALLTDASSNMQFAPTVFSPSDIFAQIWPTFHLSGAEIMQLAQSAPDELQLFAGNNGNSTIRSLSFEFCSAALVRPWLRTAVFSARFWKFREGTSPLSDGAASPQGSWPSYISAVVFARNIQITTISAPQPQPLPSLPPVDPATLREQIMLTRTGIQKSPGTIVMPGTMHPFRAALPGISAAPTDLQRNLGPVIVEHPVTPTLASVPPRTVQVQLSAVSRLASATYRATSGSSGSQPTTTTDSNISILAFICSRLPQTPNPDTSLNWGL